MNKADEFLKSLYNYSDRGNSADSLDFIMNELDDALLSGRKSFVDDVCLNLDVRRLKNSELLGIATITSHAKMFLVHRASMIIKMVAFVSENEPPERVNKMFSGLRR